MFKSEQGGPGQNRSRITLQRHTSCVLLRSRRSVTYQQRLYRWSARLARERNVAFSRWCPAVYPIL